MNKRQEKLLKLIVKEYIKAAEPISSQYLSKKHDLGVCSATVRLDMAELTEEGYLLQPHTSSGRIPTEKAYHFVIENVSEPKLPSLVEEKIETIFSKKDKENTLEELGKFLSSVSKNVSLLMFQEAMIWQGLSLIFSQPEFYDMEEVLDFTKAFEEVYCGFRERLSGAEEDLFEKGEEIKVFIGKENPFAPVDDLSLVMSGLDEGIIGILGPRRMDYQKNIALVKKAKDLLKDF
jgi:transcriptional regulator of heat shock response